MIEECRDESYNERLKMLGLTTLEIRRFRANMLEVFKILKILKGFEGIIRDCFFRIQCMKTREHSMKLYKESVNRDI